MRHLGVIHIVLALVCSWSLVLGIELGESSNYQLSPEIDEGGGVRGEGGSSLSGLPDSSDQAVIEPRGKADGVAMHDKTRTGIKDLQETKLSDNSDDAQNLIELSNPRSQTIPSLQTSISDSKTLEKIEQTNHDQHRITRKTREKSDKGKTSGPVRGVTKPSERTDGSEHLKQISGSDLLALKVDSNLRSGLSKWLAKYNISLPSSFLSRIDQLDLCPQHSIDGLPHYCTQMEDGQYYDPWNPWCGYIQCLDQSATRIVCSPGSWMGFRGVHSIMPPVPPALPKTGSQKKASAQQGSQFGATNENQVQEEEHQNKPVLMGKDDMCRKKLSDRILGGACAAHTDYNLCYMASQM